MTQKASHWLKLFKSFVADLRISSKEITSTDERGVPLVLWESQKRFLDAVGRGLDDGIHTFNCLKSRQLGCTTISLALVDVFWLAMHNNMIGCLVTDTEKNRETNRALIEMFVKSFPDGYFGEEFRITRSNRAMLAFSNGCRLDLLVAGVKRKSIAWGQGQGYSLAHLTEVGFYADVEGLKSLEEGFAQQNEHRLFVYESTANGMNHWRTRWLSGLNSQTERSFFIGWWAGDTNRIERKDPRFLQFSYAPVGEERALMRHVAQLYGHEITPEQLAWIRWRQQKAGSEQDLHQQSQPWTADQAFVMTGYSFFQTRMLAQDMKQILDDPVGNQYKGYRYEVDGDFFSFRMEQIISQDEKDRIELKVWEEPAPDGRYVIGFDPAYGRNDHKDAHAIEVFRCYADKIVQVAEYLTADVETKHAAWVLFHLCAAYANTMANVELGGPGRLVMTEFDHLRQLLNAEMNQQKVKERNWQDAGAQARWYLYHKVDSPGAGYMANFETNWRTKMELMHGFRGTYVSRELVIRSLKLLKEMQNVVVVDDKIGAPESSNEEMKDDRVFATALAYRAWQEWVRKDMLAQGLTYEVVSRQESGQETKLEHSVNQIVYRFLKTQEEEASLPKDDTPQWLRDRGLA